MTEAEVRQIVEDTALFLAGMPRAAQDQYVVDAMVATAQKHGLEQLPPICTALAGELYKRIAEIETSMGKGTPC